MLTVDDLAMAIAVEDPGGDDGALDAATNNRECGVQGGVRGGGGGHHPDEWTR